MSDNVKAALTAEEWTEWTDKGEIVRHLRYFAAYDGPKGGVLLDGPMRDRDAHAAAALCLYQQPFGFTSDDVGLCESVARDIVLGLKDLQVRQGDPARDEERDWACDTLNRRLRSLASRIQALLPPSEESQPDTNEP